MDTLLSRILGVALVVSIGAAVSAAFAAPASQPSAAGKAGEIRGTVTYCGPGGNNGIVVYLPSRSFQSKIGPGGDFVLNYVPPGTYNLVIEIPAKAPLVLTAVSTADNAITSLGTIVVCRDGDADGHTEATDCNDNNPEVNPSATEICDGFDNNCDGRVDEGCASCTDTDHDGFFAQAGCLTVIDCNDGDATIRPNAAELCNGRDDNCTGTADESFDLAIDPAHCGACDRACSFVNAVSQCITGDCVLATCNTGYTDCNADTSDGCEVLTAGDPDNCGACGNACPEGPNSTTSCTSGSCSLQCAAWFGNCDENPATGCERHLASDADNCGSCGNDCDALHLMNIQCVGGACMWQYAGPCVPGWAECDGNRGNGCETAACGGCGHPACPAPAPHMNGGCQTGGTCAYQCDQGWVSCTEDPGCETNSSDLCLQGICATRCALFNASDKVCLGGGTCHLFCNPGWADCNNWGNDGCERDLTTVGNCGACGRVCAPGQTCTEGTCR